MFKLTDLVILQILCDFLFILGTENIESVNTRLKSK